MSGIEFHPSFECLHTELIESLGIEVQAFRHKKTGALHYHLSAEQDENVFLVAFRTVPDDSTGVAHILEHTALCGSEKYPVRDPFFMMTRRSLNTFMNAFTSSDWTAYPFASQNRKDFFNLLNVYLDAAFFSRLDPLDFAQEGHRVEFATADDAATELVYKGVVFNEMKGAMSSPVQTLWQKVTQYLFPTVTYHHNSGGDPEAITDLTYQALVDFYHSHYHPSNAVFMTFGNIPAHELQKALEEQALVRFEKSDIHISVPDEKPYFSPVRVEEAYALDEPELTGKTHHVMAWLLGHSTDLKEQLKAHLLSRVLLDNSACPLRFALESTDLGSAPSPLCGLEDSNRQMSFMCGLEGSDPQQADAFEQLVLDTLQQVAQNGIAQDVLEAQLHQLELAQREISGDGYPYGLSLMMSAISPAIHWGDPVALLNLDSVLEELRIAIKDPDFIPGMIRQLLLENAHYVRLTLRPDSDISSRQEQAEKARLAAIKAAMTPQETEKVIAQAAALEARQQQQDDESILPKVTLEDVPADMHIPKEERLDIAAQPLSWYAQGTNGLVYQQVVVDLPAFNEQEQALLPLFCHCLTELGCAGRDYQQNQQLQAAVSGGIHAFTTVRGAVKNEQQVRGYFVLSGKALVRNQAALAELMQEMLESVRFDELERIREMIAQTRSRKEQSITGSGHSLALMAAAANLSPAARMAHHSRGLDSIRFYKQLDKQVEEKDFLVQLGQQLVQIHHKIKHAPRRFLLVGEADQQATLLENMVCNWQDVPEKRFQPLALPPTRSCVQQLWTTSTQVNFCAKAYPTVPLGHADAAALTVLGDFLRNGYLHRAVREQGGAYGAGAGQDSGDALFRFFSYRDPRLQETLDDFDHAVEWLLSGEHEASKLEEAILGVISSIDKPGSPAGEAKGAYHSALFGRTSEQRRAFRQQILQVTLDDLQRVARTYLHGQKASVAVVTSAETAAGLSDSFDVQAV